MINLILNAVDGVKDTGNINIYTKENDEKKTILIENNGDQISESNISKVFDPFLQLRKMEQVWDCLYHITLLKKTMGLLKFQI